jgi:hypothetical protein
LWDELVAFLTGRPGKSRLSRMFGGDSFDTIHNTDPALARAIREKQAIRSAGKLGLALHTAGLTPQVLALPYADVGGRAAVVPMLRRAMLVANCPAEIYRDPQLAEAVRKIIGDWAAAQTLVALKDEVLSEPTIPATAGCQEPRGEPPVVTDESSLSPRNGPFTETDGRRGFRYGDQVRYFPPECMEYAFLVGRWPFYPDGGADARSLMDAAGGQNNNPVRWAQNFASPVNRNILDHSSIPRELKATKSDGQVRWVPR